MFRTKSGKTRTHHVRNLRSITIPIVLAAVVATVAIFAISLGRGVSVTSQAGQVKIEPKINFASGPIAETFGNGSAISVGEGAHTVTDVTPSTSRGTARPEAQQQKETSAAQYITHGDASPIAIGRKSSASATMQDSTK